MATPRRNKKGVGTQIITKHLTQETACIGGGWGGMLITVVNRLNLPRQASLGRPLPLAGLVYSVLSSL